MFELLSVCTCLSQSEIQTDAEPSSKSVYPLLKDTHLLFDVFVPTGQQSSESESDDEAPHRQARLCCRQHGTGDPQSQGGILAFGRGAQVIQSQKCQSVKALGPPNKKGKITRFKVVNLREKTHKFKGFEVINLR